MKCSACYAENDPWVSVCLMCGEPVVPVELCDNGHILPPGSRECPLCPSMWPEAAPFAGPPVLRGVLLVDRGVLDDPAAGGAADFLEVRDREQPLAFVQPEPGRLRVVPIDAPDATVRILMRPEGVASCMKPGRGRLAFEPLPAGEARSFGGVHLRFVPFDAPHDFADVPATVTRTGRRRKG